MGNKSPGKPSLPGPGPTGSAAGSAGLRFYCGIEDPYQCYRFQRSMLSVNRLKRRVSDFAAGEWILDSGAFTEVTRHGRFREGPEAYASAVRRWSSCGRLVAAVSQDYMCEGVALKRTGLTVADHQRMTLERYDALRELVGGRVYLMPVLQGYWAGEYLRHLEAYGDRLAAGAWVGVGSVCKRNSRLAEIEQVLRPIKDARPDLRLHGFGVKLSALESSIVRACLWSADSLAWSYHARKQGRDSHDWREGRRFADQVERQVVVSRTYQASLY